MPATEEISENIIRENITRAIADVFNTMLGQDSSFTAGTALTEDPCGEPVPVSVAAGVPQVVGTVGFIGDVNGLIYLYLPADFAELCTRHLLGMSQEELTEAGDEVINDAIGELTNMSVGSFKNALCDAGYPCKLTIPSILRGSNFCIEPISSAHRYIYSFQCGGHRIVTDILLKSGD